MRLLLLGGTVEASRLARRLAERPRIETTLSLAGRTTNPAAAPLPVRTGGFGGVEGLLRYLRQERIDAVVDATHPFAAQISSNAVAACAEARVPLAAFTRPPWSAEPGDRWIGVGDVAGAAAALTGPQKRVFLTIGRQQIAAFRQLPHHFLLRAIDPPAAEDLPASVEICLDKGPFTVAEEVDLMRRHAIEVVVSKNSGGGATAAKLEAARNLELPVIMIQRPPATRGAVIFELADALAWIDAHLAPP